MKRIGKNIIRGLLGRGGMGKVFQVEIPPIGKIAALKLLDPHPVLVSLLGVERLREQFLAEAATMAGLQHPNIVAIRDFGEDDGRPFYIMDYFFSNLGRLIGETRRTEEPSRTIRLDLAIELTRQTLSGLACLHHFGIVHRDIKPFNLLIDAPGPRPRPMWTPLRTLVPAPAAAGGFRPPRSCCRCCRARRMGRISAWSPPLIPGRRRSGAQTVARSRRPGTWMSRWGLPAGRMSAPGSMCGRCRANGPPRRGQAPCPTEARAGSSPGSRAAPGLPTP